MSDELEQVAAAPEPETVESAEQGVTQSESPAGEPADAPEEKPKRKGFLDRINELTAHRRTAERERDELQERLQAIESRLSEPKPAAQPTAILPDNFETYDEYVQALAEDKAKKVIQRQIEELQQREEQNRQNARRHEIQTTLMSKMEAAAERYDDFAEVVTDPNAQITATMVEALADTDNAGDIAYFLGKNPDKARAIASLSPLAQAREIGRLDERFGAQQKTIKKPAPVTAPVRGEGGKFVKDESKMTDSEWYAARRASTKQMR